MKMSDGKPVPIWMAPELEAQIVYAAKRLKMSKQDVMRLSMSIGLEHLRTIDYNVAAAVVAAAKSAEGRVRDGGTKYKAEKKTGA